MRGLEAEVRESTVCFSHAVHIFLTFEGTTLFVVSVHDLSCKFIGHGFTTALTSEADKVLHGNRFLTVGTDFSRHLEGGTTDTARLYFDLRSDFIQRDLPDFESTLLFVLHLLTDEFESVIEDLVAHVFLTVVHEVVYELGNFLVSVNGIGEDQPLLRLCFTHWVIWFCVRLHAVFSTLSCLLNLMQTNVCLNNKMWVGGEVYLSLKCTFIA